MLMLEFSAEIVFCFKFDPGSASGLIRAGDLQNAIAAEHERFKFNIDAVFASHLNKFGIGIYIRDDL
ncbi:hypothetical protein A2U01_0077823, partial [Trifolium medium]|nr:hypothetical protein [Trifolium medium]